MPYPYQNSGELFVLLVSKQLFQINEHFQAVFLVKMVPTISIQDFDSLSTYSEMSSELRVRVHWHCYVKISIYSRYGFFLETTHFL